MIDVSKRFRFVVYTLICSAVLNVGLIAAMINLRYKEPRKMGVLTARQKGQEFTNKELLLSMTRMTFRELVSFLTNKDLVEDGYTKRDLALGSLVSCHQFYIEKALSGATLQRRSISLSPEKNIEMFPALTEEQFEAVVRFAYQEKWPLSPRGLFALLQKMSPHSEERESVEQAFMVTPEFHALQMVFQQTDAPQNPKSLLKLALEGDFAFLQSKDLVSLDTRRELLLRYIAHRSSTAAHLLLVTDFPFALKRLDDKTILEILALVQEGSSEAVRFCEEVHKSERSDLVLQTSGKKFAQLTGKELAAAPVAPPIAPVAPKKAPAPVANRYHTVRDGDTLWKISRQYKVQVDDVVRVNGLEKKVLTPGMTLKIP